jgi:hypothetical protein
MVEQDALHSNHVSACYNHVVPDGDRDAHLAPQRQRPAYQAV